MDNNNPVSPQNRNYENAISQLLMELAGQIPENTDDKYLSILNLLKGGVEGAAHGFDTADDLMRGRKDHSSVTGEDVLSLGGMGATGTLSSVAGRGLRQGATKSLTSRKRPRSADIVQHDGMDLGNFSGIPDDQIGIRVVNGEPVPYVRDVHSSSPSMADYREPRLVTKYVNGEPYQTWTDPFEHMYAKESRSTHNYPPQNNSPRQGQGMPVQEQTYALPTHRTTPAQMESPQTAPAELAVPVGGRVSVAEKYRSPVGPSARSYDDLDSEYTRNILSQMLESSNTTKGWAKPQVMSDAFSRQLQSRGRMGPERKGSGGLDPRTRNTMRDLRVIERANDGVTPKDLDSIPRTSSYLGLGGGALTFPEIIEYFRNGGTE